MLPGFLDESIIQVVDRSDQTSLTDLLRNRVTEARIALLSNFLDGCNPAFIPYKAAETLKHIGDNVIPVAEVHETHQIRLANGMQRVANPDEPGGTELLSAVVSSRIFDLYAGLPVDDQWFSGDSERCAWADNADARAQIKEALSAYVNTSSNNGSALLTRAQAILQGLDKLHPVVVVE
ncbi:hypothetical protein FB451DRAFT_1394752 [Mycena latifolia]|nr:hypothetical protein FB451DRAFT_1394752 [Mycena latifolia]